MQRLRGKRCIGVARVFAPLILKGFPCNAPCNACNAPKRPVLRRVRGVDSKGFFRAPKSYPVQRLNYFNAMA